MASPEKPKQSALDRVRQIARAWPRTEKRLSQGAPSWWGGRKTFATFRDDHHGDERTSIWIKSDFETQEGLVDASPDLFFVPPYVGPIGWLGVDLSSDRKGSVDWNIVAGLLEDGYRLVAPKRAIKTLDLAKVE